MSHQEYNNNHTAKELAQELRQSMAIHLSQKAQEIVKKFGSINYNTLEKIIQDRKFVRYPVSILFDSNRIEPGLFAITEAILQDSNQPPNEDDDYIRPVDRRYEIIVHEHFKGQPEKLLPLLLYQLPIVNYGDIVTFEDSEVFGSEIMGLSKDDYYKLVCSLVDSIPETEGL